MFKAIDTLVAVDPGLHQCGVAVWVGGRLVWADLVRNPGSVPGQGALCAPTMGFVVGEAVRPHVPKRNLSIPLVIEVPQVYTRGRGGDPNDLIDLACVVGAVMAQFADPDLVSVYRPAQWKGQVPKEVTTMRAQARLSPEELAVVGATCPPSLLHNVWDAVALGLAHKAKMGVLR